MDNQDDARSFRPEGGRGKRAWSTPELTRFKAAQAELGTNVDLPDGGFSAS